LSDDQTELPAGEVSAAPPANNLFAPVHDRYGMRLALVFGNQAPGGVCPHYRAGCCQHCDIGAGEGGQFDDRTNRDRLAWFGRHYADCLDQIAHLVLYNSGSLLDPRELSPAVLADILAFARDRPAVTVVSIESRESYVTEERLAALVAALGSEQLPRIVLGVETADDYRRNELLGKKMPRKAVARSLDEIAAASATLGRPIGVDVNVVVAGPGTNATTAIDDALETAEYAFQECGERGVPVDLNLHAYYPSQKGLARFPEQPRCSLPVLARAVAAIDRLKQEQAPSAMLFIGAEDEGHDLEDEVRDAELARAGELFDRFNRTQDAAVLGGLAKL